MISYNNIKCNKGITMVSLVMYIIGFTIIIAIVATITSNFYSNVNEDIQNDYSEILKFNIFFLEDVKKDNNVLLNLDDENKQLTFASGNTYSYKENEIYLNNIKICENIDEFDFELKKENEKNIIEVKFKVDGIDKIMQYVLNM